MSPPLRRRLLQAALLLAALLTLELLGARAATVTLSGTAPLGPSALLGLGYLLAWLAVVLVMPLLLLDFALRRALAYATEYARDKTWLSRHFARSRRRGA